MVYVKVLRDVKNETNWEVLQREDITGNSSFGAVVISAQQKSSGPDSYCTALPKIKLGVNCPLVVFLKSVSAFRKRIISSQKQTYQQCTPIQKVPCI